MSEERIFYHGTKLENLDSIKKNGLMPNTKINKRNWSKKFSKPNSIYLTTDLMSAKTFACPTRLDDEYVILEIRESALKGVKLIIDENYGSSAFETCEPWCFRVEGIIVTDFKVKEVIQK